MPPSCSSRSTAPTRRSSVAREVVHPSTVANSRRDTFTYDELGRLATKTEISAAFPSGNTTTCVYDDVAGGKAG